MFFLIWIPSFAFLLWLDKEMIFNQYFTTMNVLQTRFSSKGFAARYVLYLIYFSLLDIILSLLFVIRLLALPLAIIVKGKRSAGKETYYKMFSKLRNRIHHRIHNMSSHKTDKNRKFNNKLDLATYNINLFIFRITFLLVVLSFSSQFVPASLPRGMEITIMIAIFVCFQLVFIVLNIFGFKIMVWSMQIVNSYNNFIQDSDSTYSKQSFILKSLNKDNNPRNRSYIISAFPIISSENYKVTKEKFWLRLIGSISTFAP